MICKLRSKASNCKLGSKASNWASKFLTGDSVMVAFSIFAVCDIDVSWIHHLVCMLLPALTTTTTMKMKKIMCSRQSSLSCDRLRPHTHQRLGATSATLA
jgi:hypothetical protein